MNILIVSHEYPPIGGGGANACMHLAKEYVSSGHKVTVVTVWYEGLPEYESIESAPDIYRLRSKRAHKESCSFSEMLSFVMKASPFSKKLIKNTAVKFDVCQIFFGIPSGLIGYYLRKTMGLPYVIRFGGGDIPGFQARFNHIYKLIAPAIRLIWKNASALAANSEGLRDMACAFCDRYPIEVIPNGVDTDIYQPKPKSSDDRIRLLFVSRLIERKGLQYLIPDLRTLEEALGKPVELHVVGDGPYRKNLEELCAESKNNDRVIFYGQKDKAELPECYQKGDIFVFPSQKEGMPNAVLEAMASGLPIVMSPCQGSKELIDGNGLIADKDLTRFSESVLSLAELPEDKLKEMGQRSRYLAETRFSWKETTGKWLALMKGL